MFKLVKEIRRQDGTLHFKRWRIIETRWFNLYIHRIYQADRDYSMHNHPWWFISMVLWGKYIEKYMKDRNQPCVFARLSPKSKFRTRSAWYGPIFSSIQTFHTIYSVDKPVTTLVLTGPYRKQSWGYWCKIRDRQRWDFGEWGFLNHTAFRLQKHGLDQKDPQYE